MFQCLPMHDNDIRKWASKINRKIPKINFKASPKRINSFKKSYGIVSRKITKFVLKKYAIDSQKIQTSANNFLVEV